VHHHTHHLELVVADAPLVLDRVVSLCRARRCTIRSLRFEAADRHRPGRVLLTLQAETPRARLAAQRLRALPDVLAVAHRGAAAPAQCVSPPVVAGGRDSSASDEIDRRPREASSRTSVASSAERA
jgi:acetolactate synthase regulatory subunit